MAEDLKEDIQFGADTTGVEAGVNRVKRSLADLGGAAARAGQTSANGMNAAGEGGERASKRVETATRSMQASLQRLIAEQQAGSKSSREYWEALAAQRNVNVNSLRPLLDQLDAYKSKARDATAASDQLSGGLMGVARAAAAVFVGNGLIASTTDAAKALFEASSAAQRLQTTLEFATGGRAVTEMQYLRRVTQELGLQFGSTAVAYANFQAAAKGTTLAGTEARNVFQSVAKASAVMGLSADQTSGVLLALQQMISKGTVQAEELRGQLGERLPGAFQIAARAMGVTTAELGKMLEQGQVVASDFLPKLGKALEENLGGAAEKASGRLDAAVNRFENAWARLKQNGGDSGASNWIADQMSVGAASMDGISVAMERARAAGAGFFGQMGAGLGVMYDLGNYTGRVMVNMVENAKATKLAEESLHNLKNTAATGGDSAWIRIEIQRVENYIKRLKDAKRERDELINGGPTDPRDQTQYKSRGQSYADEAERLRGVQAAMGKVLGNLSGVKDNFYKDLNALYAGYKDGLIQLTDYQAAVAKLIKESGTEKADRSGAAAIKAEQNAYESLAASIKTKIAQNDEELKYSGRLSESDKLRLKMLAELEAGSKTLNAEHKGRAIALLEVLAAQEREIAATKRAVAAYQEQADIQAELAADYVAQSRAREAGRQTVADYAKGILDANEALRYELSLMGMGEQAREVALEQYRVELELKRQIAAVNANAGFNQQQRDEEIARLQAAAAIARANASSKVFLDNWKESVKQYDDIFRQGFADMLNNGQDGWKSFTRSLVTTFKTTVADQIYKMFAQPFVVNIVGNLMGLTGGGGAGGVAGAVAGGSSLLNTASNVGSAASFLSGNSLLSAVPGLGAIGGALSGFGTAITASIQSLVGITGTTSQMVASLAAAGHTAAPGVAAGVQAANLIPGWGWALAGVGALFGGDIISGLFGRKLKDQGIEGTFGGPSDFEGRTYQYYKGGLFRSNKTRYGELDEDLRSGLADQFGALQAGTSEMAKILGLGTDAIDNFTASIKISFNGLDEAGIQNALKAEFEKIAESLSSQTLGTTEFTRNGETAVQTLGRLSGSLSAVNSVFENLSQTLYASSLAGADMASQLVDLFGGADGFNSATGSYFQNFYSEDEQRAAMERQLQAALDKLDLTLPDIDAADARAQWRAQAEALDLTTEAGRKAWAVLIQLSGAFAGITQSAEDAAAAAAAAAAAQARQAEASRSKEQDLQIQLLRAQGNELAAVAIERQRELAALEQFGPAAQGIQRDIWAIIDAAAALQAGADAYFADVDRKAAEQGYVNDAQTALDAIFGSVNAGAQAAAQSAASAAQAAAGAWRSAASSIQSSLDKLRADTTAGMDPAARLSLTRAQLGAYTTAALGGDADAASKMAGAADAFLQASEAGSITRADYLRDRITTEAQLASVLESSEAKASVQESIAAAANASVSELQALNANLTGFAGSLYELLSKGYQGADRGAAQTVAQSFAKMQADYDAYFNDLAGFGKVGNKYTDASFNGASFTKLGNNMAAFTGADGIVSYIRAGESLVEVAKRIPELRALWEKNYGIKLPAFDVGANYIPYDMPAMVHKGERIIPAADNRALMSALQNGAGGANAELVNEIRALRAEVASLRAAAAETADNTRNLPQMVDQFDNVTEGGNAIRNNQMNVVAA